MKYFLVVIALALGACASPAVVTNKPSVTPVRESNRQTRAEIKNAKTKIGEVKDSNEKGASSLKDAIGLLDQLLSRE